MVFSSPRGKTQIFGRLCAQIKHFLFVPLSLSFKRQESGHCGKDPGWLRVNTYKLKDPVGDLTFCFDLKSAWKLLSDKQNRTKQNESLKQTYLKDLY